MHVDRISVELPIFYYEGLPINISIKLCISVPEVCFYLSKQCRPC